MYRQSPSRIQRSKRFKLKHVLQMCLLFCVSIWLMYQLMHSHAKKKEYDESNAKVSIHRPSGDGLMKLGRKGIQVEETISKNEVMLDEEASEEEENKDEEDDTDEQDREKPGAEFGKEDEFIDNEERDDGDEKENGEEDSEEDEHLAEKEGSTEENHRDGEDWSMHEAREEHYKADDASSAVTHDSGNVVTENENLDMVSQDERLGSILGKENERSEKETEQVEYRNDLELEVGERSKDGESQFDVTNKENLLDASKNSSFSNDIIVSDESTDVIIENHNSSLQNMTEISVKIGKPDMPDSDQANNSRVAVEINNTVLESNSQISSLSNNKSSETEKITLSNKTESSSEKDDSINLELTAIRDSKDDGLDSKGSEDLKEVQLDPIDISDSFDVQEEKGVEKDQIRLDLES